MILVQQVGVGQVPGKLRVKYRENKVMTTVHATDEMISSMGLSVDERNKLMMQELPQLYYIAACILERLPKQVELGDLVNGRAIADTSSKLESSLGKERGGEDVAAGMKVSLQGTGTSRYTALNTDRLRHGLKNGAKIASGTLNPTTLSTGPVGPTISNAGVSITCGNIHPETAIPRGRI
jgi:hypothetical protein